MWDVVSRKLAKYLRLDTLMGKFYIEYIFGFFYINDVILKAHKHQRVVKCVFKAR